MKYLIAGGTGLIGRKLLLSLVEDGNEVTVLSRSPRESTKHILRYAQWDGETVPKLDRDFDAVINLSGAGIMDKAWTKSRKKELEDSRLKTTNALVDFINKAEKKPKVFVNASAVGFYGNKGKEKITEETSRGNNYVAELCERWEQAALKANTRVVLLRTGLVLAKEGGLLPESLLSFHFGVAAYFGDGKHGYPWIHIADEVGAIRFCVENEKIEGAVNLAAPGIVNNKEFTEAIKKEKSVFIQMPVPEFAIELMFGARAALLLSSQWVKPKKLLEAGYEFKYPELQPALEDLLD